MILTLITLGKYLEARSKGKTTDALRALMDLSPKTASVVRDGAEITVPVTEVLSLLSLREVILFLPGVTWKGTTSKCHRRSK